MVEVVAALIWRGERFMICRRPAHKARGLLWEFVGGKVEKGESALREMGFSDLRIRVFHGAARLQLPADQLPDAVQKREDIRCALGKYFPAVLLDLEARPESV